MATTVTDQIFTLAEKAGLRPAWEPAYRGVATITLNGEGPDAVFGTIQVGDRSGKILRAELVHGNGGTKHTYTGAVEVRAALKAIHTKEIS